MLQKDDNLTDIQVNPIKDTSSMPTIYSQNSFMLKSYSKLNKLITALYIVTDIIDKEEPIRLKLRTLGAEILSDINFGSRTELGKKVETILSFLDIALAIGLISEMNFNILKKEFNEFGRLLEDSQNLGGVNHTWLEEFLKPKVALVEKTPQPKKPLENKPKEINSPNVLRKQRREDIVEAIKENGGSATISEVKLKASLALASCGEKTLQRELIAMVKDHVLDKTGEKRWSKYSLKN